MRLNMLISLVSPPWNEHMKKKRKDKINKNCFIKKSFLPEWICKYRKVWKRKIKSKSYKQILNFRLKNNKGPKNINSIFMNFLVFLFFGNTKQKKFHENLIMFKQFIFKVYLFYICICSTHVLYVYIWMERHRLIKSLTKIHNSYE